VLTIASLLTASVVSLQTGTVIDLGVVERDLTGDGRPEILRVVGVGPGDSLAVTFTIESDGRTIYRFEMAPLTRTTGFDAGRYVVPAEQRRARIEAFQRWFFAEEKFQRAAEFLASLKGMGSRPVAELPDVIARDRPASDTRTGRAIWQELLGSRTTIFTFSPGGDAIVAIGWSAQASRFYRLLECC
jgi:hypothetical protein